MGYLIQNMHRWKDQWSIRAALSWALVVILAGIVGVIPAAAQDNGEADTLFAVTVETKTSEHPYFDEGFNEGFVIDGVEGDELTLERGQTYYFVMEGVPSFHPFYITTNADGGDGGDSGYTSGVTSTLEDHDDRAWGEDSQDTLKFTPDDDAPDLLYYNCTAHAQMGYEINIVDPTTTDIDDQVATDELPAAFRLRGNYPNPFNPSTTVRFDLPASADVEVQLYDMLGRRVMTVDGGRIAAGAARTIRIDGSPLTSGIYLYRVLATSAEEMMVGTGQMTLVK